MTPSIFPLVAASSAVTALIGSSPVRFYLFGQAPQTVTKPYAVWQIVAGQPENYLGNTPDIDYAVIQIDAYGETAASARAVYAALRDAIEPRAHITSFGGESRDEPTGLYRVSFDVSWFENR